MIKLLLSRKFILALLTLIMSSVALGLTWLTGGEWVMVVSLIMGMYSAANIIQPKLEKNLED